MNDDTSLYDRVELDIAWEQVEEAMNTLRRKQHSTAAKALAVAAVLLADAYLKAGEDDL